MTVTPRDRVLAAIQGEVIDRPPMTLWRHWPIDDQDAEVHATVAVEHHGGLGLDLLKLTPSAAYMSEAWGARTEYRGDVMGVRDYVSRPIGSAADWDHIVPLDVAQSPSLQREVDVVRLVRDHVGPAVPVLPTVFTPLSVVRYLAGDGFFLPHLRMHRADVERALDAITETTIGLVRALLAAGADGIYFSLLPASHTMVSMQEYREVALPRDQQVFAAAEDSVLRVAHFHLPFPLLPLSRHLPANVVSWEHAGSGPSLAEGMEVTGKAVMGGVDQLGLLAHGRAADVAAEVRRVAAIAREPRSHGVIVATSCSYPLTAPRGNLLAFSRSVRGLGEDVGHSM